MPPREYDNATDRLWERREDVDAPASPSPPAVPGKRTLVQSLPAPSGQPAPSPVPGAIDPTASPEDVANRLRLMPYGESILRLFGRAAAPEESAQTPRAPVGAEAVGHEAVDPEAAGHEEVGHEVVGQGEPITAQATPAAASSAGAESQAGAPPAGGSETVVAAAGAIHAMVAAATPAGPPVESSAGSAVAPSTPAAPAIAVEPPPADDPAAAPTAAAPTAAARAAAVATAAASAAAAPTATAPTAAVSTAATASAAAAVPATAGTGEFIGTRQTKDKDRQVHYTNSKGQTTRGWDVGSAHHVKHAGGQDSAAAYAVSNVEGTYDNVQTYDSAVLTFGIMQWTVHAGSLQNFLGYLKCEAGPAARAAFDEHLGSHQIDIQKQGANYQLFYQGQLHKGAEDFDRLIRHSTESARQWVDWFHALGVDPRAQKAEFDHAKRRFREVQNTQLSDGVVDAAVKKCPRTLRADHRGAYHTASYWTAESPKAAMLYFSMNVNNPTYANAALLKAIDDFYSANGKDREKWQRDWPDRFATILEAKCRETLPSWGDGKAEGRVTKTLRFWDQANRQGAEPGGGEPGGVEPGGASTRVAAAPTASTHAAARHGPATASVKPSGLADGRAPTTASVKPSGPAGGHAPATASVNSSGNSSGPAGDHAPSSVLDYATGLAQQVANRLMTAETATLQTFDFMHSTQPPSRYIAHPEARADSHARPGPAEHEAPAPSGAPKADHTHKGYDTDNHGLDSYGNATERKQSRAAHVMDGQHRVFETSFTTIRDAALYPGPTDQKKLPHPLPDGSRVRLGAVATSRVQIITGDISAADHVWIDFAALGGHGADLGLGNERHDAADNQRGAAIRDGLPGGRQPGSRKFTWGFGGGFLPALDGVALDGSLMTKVHALMEWAIYNDMVLGDIRITSGMRSPRTAHFLCVRYEIGESKMARVSMEDLQRLPDGRDHDGNQWYQPGWTRQQIIDNALSKYEKGSKHAVAAAGYDFGDPRRAPLPLSSAPGVSRHCSGHAVDVDIPWRSAADPNERDLWGWEQIYHQFGLTRPLHRDRGFSGSKPESWHVEETGKSLATEAGE